jgi:drug/metabolite transporter (DMT)-like permease
MSGNLRGSMFMVLAMCAFSVEDMLFKIAIEDLPKGIALVGFGLFGMMFAAGLSVQAGEPVLHPAFLSRGLLLRSAMELSGRLFYALSLAFVPLATTSAILQATPLVVTLGAAALFGEKVGVRRWVVSGLGFAGVMMILRPSPAVFEPTVIFAVLGMLGFAGRDLATRASPPSVSGKQLGTLGFMVVFAAGLILTAFNPEWPTQATPRAVASVIATAMFGVGAYNALTTAMRSGEVSVVAPFRYSRLLVALVIAYVVFGERPDALTLAGAALIVASGVYMLLSGRRQGKTGVAATIQIEGHRRP